MAQHDKKPKLRLVRPGEHPDPQQLGIHHEAVYGVLAQLVTAEMSEDPELLREALRDVYTELSLGDELLVHELAALEEAGAIFHEDKLYLFVLFSVAGAHGMAEVQGLRDAIVRRRIDPVAISAQVSGLPLPEPLKKYLSMGIGRIHLFHEHVAKAGDNKKE